MNENEFYTKYKEISSALRQDLNSQNLFHAQSDLQQYIFSLTNPLFIDFGGNKTVDFYKQYSKKREIEHIDFVEEYIESDIKEIAKNTDFIEISRKELDSLMLADDSNFSDIFRIFQCLDCDADKSNYFLSNFLEKKAENYLNGLVRVDKILQNTMSYEDRMLVAIRIYQENYFFDCYQGLFDTKDNLAVMQWLVSIWFESLLPFAKLHFIKQNDFEKCSAICSKYCS